MNHHGNIQSSFSIVSFYSDYGVYVPTVTMLPIIDTTALGRLHSCISHAILGVEVYLLYYMMYSIPHS